ncbi:MAG: hypothetical protein H7641_03060 [Candidatus Heimdallarchaeota archaeon]|nr:hypothetical protein [Candidatus Heimdallarchaeota archaeon]MCK4876544.1 hypothetical protein [Candidatus Heimdallarchaeota archaeon]
MDSNPTKPTDVKAKIIQPNKVELPKFEFEDMLIEHYKKYPRTAGMVENPRYVEALQNPFKKFYLVPLALFGLKMNTILSLKWKDYLKLWIYIVIMSIPTFIMVYFPFVGKTDPLTGNRVVVDVTVSIYTPILIAVLLSLFYLKFTHDGFLGLVLEKRVEWIEEPVREYYSKFYDRKIPKNPLIILLALGTGLAVNIPLILSTPSIALFPENVLLSQTFGVISCILSPIWFYIFYVETYYLIQNTRLYSKILNSIEEKIEVYLNEYGTLLTRENYDIIWALGDKWSKGRSIRQIENIPVAGILSALIITIAMMMGSINAIIYGIVGRMPEIGFNLGTLLDSSAPWTVIVIVISVLLAIILFLVVFLPLNSLRKKLKKFKIKALIELDNYIFANVVEFETRYAEEAREESVTMFQLREYIAGMRTFPISTNKLFRTIVAVVIWVVNIQKIFRAVTQTGA